jgi:hypothetical protein
MFGVRGTSVVGATAADAPPASEKVSPAAPNTGTAFVTRFRFEACFTRGMVASSVPCKKILLTPAGQLYALPMQRASHATRRVRRVPKFRLMNEAFTMTVAHVAPNLGAHVKNGR